MAKYTQNSEGDIILSYFKENIHRTMSCLSIGENDGKTLSNVLELIESNWSATLVEPSPIAYKKLWELHENNENVHCFQVAIGTKNEIIDFYDSGAIDLSAYGKGDNVSLVSTAKKEDYEKWKDATKFELTKVQVITFQQLMEASPIKKFDFISIDAEGFDLEILQQINLKEIGCKMICVEFNWKDQDKFDAIVLPQGYHLLHKNAENLIYCI